MPSSSQLYNIQPNLDDICVKTNVLKSSFRCLDIDSKVHLYNAHCLSLYGCELWNLEDPMIHRLEVTWRKSVRNFLELPNRTRSYIIPQIMGTNDVLSIIEQRQLNFIIKCLNHNSKLVQNITQNAFLCGKSYIVKNVNRILSKSNISYRNLFDGKKIKIERKLCDKWRVDLIKELLFVRDQKLYIELDNDQFNSVLNYVCCF